MAPPSMNIPPAIALLACFAAVVSSAAAFSLPCIPIPLLSPCHHETPPPPPPKEPTECRSHLMHMMPCAGFLTGAGGVAAAPPPAACCDGFLQVAHEGAAICYCRVVDGDIGQLFGPAAPPINFTRVFALDDVCAAPFQLRALARHCDRDGAPPMTLPATPPSTSARPRQEHRIGGRRTP